VDRIWFQSFHTDLATALTQQLRQHALFGVRAALEAALDEEMASYLATWTNRENWMTLSEYLCRVLAAA
jgi:hypothetical protein